MTRNRDEHIELGFIDIPKAYLDFTVKQKKAVCNKIIDLLLIDIDKNLDPTINRITFLDEVLESSLATNEEDEEYIVCQVLFDCRKYLNIE
jgi:hypothetical protein